MRIHDILATRPLKEGSIWLSLTGKKEFIMAEFRCDGTGWQYAPGLRYEQCLSDRWQYAGECYGRSK